TEVVSQFSIMAAHLLSWSSPLRTFGSTMSSMVAGRSNSTLATDAAAYQRAASANQRPRVFSRRRVPNRQKFIEDQKTQGESRILEKYQTRDWRAGDIYTPHDLSAAEMKKWRKRYSPATDAFDSLNMNPLDLYKVCAVFKWTIFFIVGSGTPVIVNSFYVNAELLDHV
ncbi:hypothetical protein G4B84_002776, partial [Aspergillus flavus NRRL3357]